MGNVGKNLLSLAAVLAAVALLSIQAAAQESRGGGDRGRSHSHDGGDFRGGGDFGGGPPGEGGFFRGGPPEGGPGFGFRGPGGGGPGGGGPGGYYPSRGSDFAGGGPPFGRPEMSRDSGSQSSRYDYILQRMDRNGDGKIDPNELEGPAKSMYEGMAQRAGLDPSKPISLEKIRKAMTDRSHDQEEGDKRDGDASGGKKGSKEPETPLVPGFGLAQNLPSVPGFGVRVPGSSVGGSVVAATAASSDASSSSSGAVSEKSRTEYKVRGYAKGIIEKYDRNKDGSLDKEERGQMKSDPKDADRNNDGVITEDELVAKFMKDDKGRDGSSGSSRLVSQKTYRYVPPSEKLPEGLPDWFVEYDENEDGQVAMHEFASDWDNSTAQRFCHNDLNNDGVITPTECLDAMSREPEPEAVSAAVPNPVSASKSDSEPKKSSSGGGGYWWTQ
jgi:Ca2+-binding EF-hand superfamily protein